MSDDDSGSTFLAFVVGGLAGAVLALLYAPRTGKETRDLLGEKVREAEERGRDLKEQVRTRGRAIVDEASDYLDRQRDSVEQRKERFAAAVDAGRQTYREEKERGEV